ncbi:MAG: glycosyltransferase family 2 protein, partial [Pedobacter sp.]
MDNFKLNIITVIICVYNEEYSILNALRSLRNNDIYSQTEIILIDDHSTNLVTIRILNLLTKFTQIKLIKSEKNLGLSNSRNLGFSNANTDYIFPLDADDTFPPQALDMVYQEFVNDPNIDFVAGDYETIDIETNEVKQINCYSVSTENYIDQKKLANDWKLLGTSPCKKSTWVKNGGYNLKYSYTVQDVDFWIRILKNKGVGKYINKKVYKWHKSNQGMNAQFNRFEMIKLLEDHTDFYQLTMSKREIYNKIFEAHYPYKKAITLIKIGKTHFLKLRLINQLRFISIL